MPSILKCLLYSRLCNFNKNKRAKAKSLHAIKYRALPVHGKRFKLLFPDTQIIKQ